MSDKTTTVEIKHRFSGAVLFFASVDVSLSDGLRIGAAVKLAIKAHANLTGADLAHANLTGAYLAHANLTGANLTGADLADANLADANLTRANDLLDCGSPYSWRVAVVRHSGGIRITAGCQWMTFKEATAHWKKRGEERALMLPLLAYVKAAAKIKGWKL